MKKESGFSLVELLIVVAIIGIISAIAIPGLLKARSAGNEASAIGSLRAINSAEAVYAASCGNGGYASTLAALVLPPAGGQPFLSKDLTTGLKSGYVITMAVSAVPNGGAVLTPAAATCNLAMTDAVAGYWAGAVPASIGQTGQRSYATDTGGTIFRDDTGAAIGNPIPAGTPFIQ